MNQKQAENREEEGRERAQGEKRPDSRLASSTSQHIQQNCCTIGGERIGTPSVLFCNLLVQTSSLLQSPLFHSTDRLFNSCFSSTPCSVFNFTLHRVTTTVHLHTSISSKLVLVSCAARFGYPVVIPHSCHDAGKHDGQDAMGHTGPSASSTTGSLLH